MLQHNSNTDQDGERGFALLAVLFVMAIFFVVAGVLLFQSATERAVVVNHGDYSTALNYAEAGIAWADRRINDAPNLTGLLVGPDTGDAADDYLLGLRDLSLTATSQFTGSNKATASAIVQRDFTGDGNKSYEVVRLQDGTDAAALVYVRLDDNYDDDPADPGNNDPLADQDGKVQVTVAAEYPVFLDSSGAELTNLSQRGRAVRVLRAEFSASGSTQPAIGSSGDIDFTGGLKVCGDCGDVHTNSDLYVNSGNTICGDGTASGSFSGSSSAIQGTAGGSFPVQPFPIISPYDDLFVPAPEVFDQITYSSEFSPCSGPATSGQPGNAKYFALVADNDKGKIYKAYWDSADARWEWEMINNLANSNVQLDNCGRVPGDAGYDSSKAVDDGKDDEFYGWKAASTWQNESCSSCGSSNGDDSLCTLANNDYSTNGFIDFSSNSVQAQGSGHPNLPGDFSPDSSNDFNPTSRVKDGTWDFSASTIYSPLYGAVLFVYGNTMISGNPGDSSAIDYCKHSGCSGSLPNGLWKLSIVSYGSIELSGQANLGPANPDEDFAYLLVAGRDIMINGNPQEDTLGCGSTCSSTAPSAIADMGGIYAAHEQVQFSGNPNIFGFVTIEDAIDCSPTVDGQGRGVSEFNGNAQVFYDCQHPPSPWVTAGSTQRLNWNEVR